MRCLAVAFLIVTLAVTPSLAEVSPWSFPAEFGAGLLAAGVCLGGSVALGNLIMPPADTPSSLEASLGGGFLTVFLDILAAPPLAAAAVTWVGGKFGATGVDAFALSVFCAYVGEVLGLLAPFELQIVDIPDWLWILAVPGLTALGATVGFNLGVWAEPETTR